MPQNFSRTQVRKFVFKHMELWESAVYVGQPLASIDPVADLIYKLLRAVEEGKPFVAKVSADTENVIVARVVRLMEDAIADAEEILEVG